MKKTTKQFLTISFILGYLCFGIIAFSNTLFGDIFSNPKYLSLFILGFLSPFISALIVFVLNKDELGGMEGFASDFKTIKSQKAIVLVPIFLLAHYGLGAALKNVDIAGGIKDLVLYLPLMILIFGPQEIGWRRLLQPDLEESYGYYKSVIISGLFWALWFLPLVFIRGFIVLPQFYTQFAAYIIGISFLLTSLYKASGSVVYSSLLSSLIFAFAPILVFKQGFMLVGIAVLEVILVSLFRDKSFN